MPIDMEGVGAVVEQAMMDYIVGHVVRVHHVSNDHRSAIGARTRDHPILAPTKNPRYSDV